MNGHIHTDMIITFLGLDVVFIHDFFFFKYSSLNNESISDRFLMVGQRAQELMKTLQNAWKMPLTHSFYLK